MIMCPVKSATVSHVNQLEHGQYNLPHHINKNNVGQFVMDKDGNVADEGKGSFTVLSNKQQYCLAYAAYKSA
jgi:hypothetical protein